MHLITKQKKNTPAFYPNYWTNWLAERQIKALKLMVNERKKLTRQKYQEIFKVSKATAYRDLTNLKKKNMIKEKGKHKNTKYSAK